LTGQERVWGTRWMGPRVWNLGVGAKRLAYTSIVSYIVKNLEGMFWVVKISLLLRARFWWFPGRNADSFCHGRKICVMF